MNEIIKWAVKKFISTDKIKEAIHAANAKLAAKETTARTAAIIGYCNDANAVVAEYTKAFGNDGKMDEGELLAVNARCDEMVDKYLGADKLDALVDAVLG